MTAEATSGWSRNWKWILPVGCLSAIALFAGVVALFLFAVSGVVRSSEVYVRAMETIRASPPATEALGTPIEDGIFPSGNVRIDGSSGKAELAIPVSGPKGSGTLYLEARRSAGEWSFTKLILELADDGRRIDLR